MQNTQLNVEVQNTNVIRKCVPNFIIGDEAISNNRKLKIREARIDERNGGFKYLAWDQFKGVIVHESMLKPIN